MQIWHGLIIVGVFFSCVFASAHVRTYTRESARNTLFDVIDHPSVTNWRAIGTPPTTRHRAFLEYSTQVVQPQLNQIYATWQARAAWRVLIDSGSYTGPEELKLWQERSAEISDRLNSFSVNKSWTETLSRWAELAEGLSGTLPEQARRAHYERQLEAFPENLKPKLNELSDLEKQFRLAQNQAPSNSTLVPFNKALSEAIRHYKSGEITFAQAEKIFRETYATSGPRLVGRDALAARGTELNRIAVLRSELARAKGFRTWAEYKLEENGQGYDPAYRGPVRQREFLRRILFAIAPGVEAYFTNRAASVGLKPSEMRLEFQPLLTPSGTELLLPYFPPERLTQIWQDTMLESGFKPETLQQIFVDDEVRTDKNLTGAYMMTLRHPNVEPQNIDATSLSVAPPSRDSKLWQPGLMYILQNYKNGGVDSLRTAFHEGGHALEYLLKQKLVDTPEGYGSVEVPSTTLQQFILDPEFLFAKAVPIDGIKPSLERIRELVQNEENSLMFNVSRRASHALFDTEIWDYDYAAPNADTFTERAQTVLRDIDLLAHTPPPLEGAPARYLQLLATNHFVSGEVRNIGYTFADIGAKMMVAFVSDELEKSTGRRSWSEQPGLAKILTERFFAEGWKLPFPTNMESITGRPFDATAQLQEIAAHLAECEAALK